MFSGILEISLWGKWDCGTEHLQTFRHRQLAQSRGVSGVSADRAWGSLSGLVGDVTLCRRFDMFLVKTFDIAPTDSRWRWKHCDPSKRRALHPKRRGLALQHLTVPTLTCTSLSLCLSQSHSQQIVTFSVLLSNTNCPLFVSVGREGNFIPGSKIDPWLVHCSLAHRYLWHLLICQRVLTSWWRGKWLRLTNWYKLLAEATTVVMTVRWPCRICRVIDGSKQSLGNTWLGPAGRLLMVLQFRCLSHTLLTILTLRLSTQ